jgi:amino acid permease
MTDVQKEINADINAAYGENSSLTGDFHADAGDEQHAPASCQPLPHGSVAASAFNLASATLGAGTLALPSAMATTGDAIGVIMLIISCAATIYSIRLIIIVVERTGFVTYEEIAKNLVGPKFEKFVAGLIVAFCWGTTLVYVVAIGKVLASFDKSHGFPGVFKGEWGHRFITTIFWCLFMLPLSLAKEINTLRYASLFGMFSTAFLVCAIVVHSAESGKNELKAVNWGYKMVTALPVFSFSYCCQTNSFEIYAELNGRSVRKMTFTTAVSMMACTCIYVVAGIAGFAEFGTNTDGDILSNYGLPTQTPYIAVAVVAITFTLTMAFPICIFPTRDAVVQLMGYRTVYETPSRTRLLVAGGLATGSLIVGLFVPGISLLFGILGGVFGSSLGYILPVVFAWKSGEWTVETVGWPDVIGTWALLIGGIICGIFGTAVTLINTF